MATSASARPLTQTKKSVFDVSGYSIDMQTLQSARKFDPSIKINHERMQQAYQKFNEIEFCKDDSDELFFGKKIPSKQSSGQHELT